MNPNVNAVNMPSYARATKNDITNFQKLVNEVKGLFGYAQDDVTDLHLINVSRVATLLADVNGCNTKVIRVAAWLHDVAKYTKEFQALVSYEGTFTPEMRAKMAAHAKNSAKMVSRFKWLIRLYFGLTAEETEWVLFLIENHHIRNHADVEALDIPEELKLLLAIIILSDVYDAVRARRSYKGAFSVEDAFVEMEAKDPETREPLGYPDKQFNAELFFQLKDLMLELDVPATEGSKPKANA